VKQLGFTQPWRYEEEGKAWVAQVDRQGCELILSSQWPDKVGKGLMFISLVVGVLDALRAELEGRGVDVKDGQWGYRLMVIADPDGNELYFPYPTSLATGSSPELFSLKTTPQPLPLPLLSLFSRSTALVPWSAEGPTPCLNRYRNT
jgi:hypothetical protein